MAKARKNLWERLGSVANNGRKGCGNWNAFFSDLDEEYPTLRAFLQGMPPDVGYIEGGSIQFFADHQTPKLRLSDRHNGNVAFLTGYTLKELLKQAEDGLAGDSIPWRPDPYRKQKGKVLKG